MSPLRAVPSPADDEIGLLEGHLLDGLGGLGEVIRGPRISFRDVRGVVFQVGEIDVDDAFQRRMTSTAVVAVGVPDEGDVEAAGQGDAEGPEDGQDDVGRGDEVDVVGALPWRSEHHGRELLVRDRARPRGAS